VTLTVEEIVADLGQASPTYHLWAKNITEAKNVKNKKAPEGVDLARMITSVQINASIKGTDNIVITLEDPDFLLMQSGFWDLDEDGKLDLIDVNYPDGSRFWWRNTICSPSDSGAVSMTFIDRAAADMLLKHGKFKSDRASHTRAQAVKALVDRTGGIEFYSLELNIVEPIAAPA
jgi:hypothetical protein